MHHLFHTDSVVKGEITVSNPTQKQRAMMTGSSTASGNRAELSNDAPIQYCTQLSSLYKFIQTAV